MQSSAATQAQINAARSRAAAWLITQQQGDGRVSNGHGSDVAVTSRFLVALANAGVRGFPFQNGQSWIMNAEAQSVDELARQVTVSIPGATAKGLFAKLLSSKSTNGASIWGTYPKYGTSITDTSLAISASLSGIYDYPNFTNELASAVFCFILPRQTAPGGWPHAVPAWLSAAPATVSSGAIDPTAAALVGLSDVRAATSWDANTCNGQAFSISTALTNGANWLLTQRNGDGGLGEKGISTILSTAIGYQGISAVRPADGALPGLLDYLIARQDANGSWGGEPFQTAASLIALNSVASPMTDTDGDGIPDDVEIILGTNPNIFDRGLFTNLGNNVGVPGQNLPIVLAAQAILNQPFSFTLTSPGVAPFAWGLTGGNLPPGLTLSASGTISGTPTLLGTYPFQYAALDSGSPKISRSTIGMITVVRTLPGNGDINGDGVVDLADLMLAQQIALGRIVPTAQQKAAADVAPIGQPDGVIDAADVAWIARRILQLE